METVNMHEAKTQLSKLVETVVSEGREIVIAKAGKPAARLVPVVSQSPLRKPGALKGRIQIAEDFDAPLPEGVQALFEGR